MPRRYSQQQVEDLVEEFTGGFFKPDPEWILVTVELPIPGTCLVCGNTNCGPRLYDLRRGKGFCKRCAGLESPSQERAEELINDYSDGLFRPDEGWRYVNALTPIPGTCLVCGKEDCAPRLAHLQQGRGHCKRCAGQESPSQDQAVAQVKEWTAGLFEPEPGWTYVNAHTPIRGTCLRCGKDDCAPAYHQLRKGQGYCARCAGQEPLTHEDALEIIAATTEGKFEPVAGWRYEGIDAPIPGTCLVCGYTGCRPRIWTLKVGQGYCRHCSGSGFRPDEPGILYLLHHKAHRLLKVGICNVGSPRIDNFVKRGWQEVESRRFQDGAECHSAEERLHQTLAERLARLDPPASDLAERADAAGGNLYGHTEMYPLEMFREEVALSLDDLSLQ
jgi:hypothetical protein